MCMIPCACVIARGLAVCISVQSVETTTSERRRASGAAAADPCGEDEGGERVKRRGTFP